MSADVVVLHLHSRTLPHMHAVPDFVFRASKGLHFIVFNPAVAGVRETDGKEGVIELVVSDGYVAGVVNAYRRQVVNAGNAGPDEPDATDRHVMAVDCKDFVLAFTVEHGKPCANQCNRTVDDDVTFAVGTGLYDNSITGAGEAESLSQRRDVSCRVDCDGVGGE